MAYAARQGSAAAVFTAVAYYGFAALLVLSSAVGLVDGVMIPETSHFTWSSPPQEAKLYSESWWHMWPWAESLVQAQLNESAKTTPAPASGQASAPLSCPAPPACPAPQPVQTATNVNTAPVTTKPTAATVGATAVPVATATPSASALAPPPPPPSDLPPHADNISGNSTNKNGIECTSVPPCFCPQHKAPLNLLHDFLEVLAQRWFWSSRFGKMVSSCSDYISWIWWALGWFGTLSHSYNAISLLAAVSTWYWEYDSFDPWGPIRRSNSGSLFVFFFTLLMNFWSPLAVWKWPYAFASHLSSSWRGASATQAISQAIAAQQHMNTMQAADQRNSQLGFMEMLISQLSFYTASQLHRHASYPDTSGAVLTAEQVDQSVDDIARQTRDAVRDNIGSFSRVRVGNEIFLRAGRIEGKHIPDMSPYELLLNEQELLSTDSHIGAHLIDRFNRVGQAASLMPAWALPFISIGSKIPAALDWEAKQVVKGARELLAQGRDGTAASFLTSGAGGVTMGSIENGAKNGQAAGQAAATIVQHFHTSELASNGNSELAELKAKCAQLEERLRDLPQQEIEELSKEEVLAFRVFMAKQQKPETEAPAQQPTPKAVAPPSHTSPKRGGSGAPPARTSSAEASAPVAKSAEPQASPLQTPQAKPTTTRKGRLEPVLRASKRDGSCCAPPPAASASRLRRRHGGRHTGHQEAPHGRRARHADRHDRRHLCCQEVRARRFLHRQ